MANELNNYFSSVFGLRQDCILYSLFDKSTIKITRDGVKKLITYLKPVKAPGPDELQKRDLCLAIDEISSFLTLILQYSLDMGRLPSQWKQANVVLFKSGCKQAVGNYRSASSTCICSKFIKHIVLHHISSKLNDILIPQQHDFRQRLSCTSQLLITTQSILNKVDKGGCVQAVGLDFSKAFDKVSHALLIDKRLSYGFTYSFMDFRYFDK